MKAFRGEPSIFTSVRPEEKRAELQVRGLTLKSGSITILNRIDLSLSSGELFAIIGPNGAGKSSLLNCISGYLKAQEGQIFFNGQEVTSLLPRRLAEIGIVIIHQGISFLPKATVQSNLLLARHIYFNYGIVKASLFAGSVQREEVHNRKIVEELIDFLEMQPIRKKPVDLLSYGMRKRVELGMALAMEPTLLILDEFFVGMTLQEKKDTVRFLTELNTAWSQTIILAENDMALAISISKKVAALDFGVKIAEGDPDFVQNHPQVVKAYFGDIAIAGRVNTV